MAVTLLASGTTAQTSGGAEAIISAPNVAGAFQLHLDMNLLAAGDVIELRVYKMVKASGTSRVVLLQTMAGAQPADAQIAISSIYFNTLTDATAVQFGIKQTFGTTRALPYAVLNVEDATDVTAIKAKTDNLPAAPASTTNITAGTITTVTNLTNAPTAGDLTATMKTSVTTAVPTAIGIADAAFARSLGTEAVSADGAVPTLAQALFEILSSLGEFSISGTTITCKKRDGSTSLFTSTLDSSTAPTSRTRAT